MWRFPRHYGQQFSQHRNWKKRDSKQHQQQIVRNTVYVNFASYFASSHCFGLSVIRFPLFFKEKLLILFFVWLKPVFLLFLLTCLFALSFFLSHSFSAFKYHHLFNSLFRFSFGSIAHYLSTFPLIFVCSSLFFLFYRRFSCSQLWAVIWFSFNFVQDFLLVSLSLSFFFPLFFFFSCWLSSTYDLIWIFVAFLTATGIVSLKSDFASQYQNCNFMIRYLNYSTCKLLYCRFSFLFFIFISSFINFLAWNRSQ